MPTEVARPTYFNVRDFPSAISCPSCRKAIVLTPATFVSYFGGTQPTCVCGITTDLLDGLLSDIRRTSLPEFILGAVGATTTQFSLQVVPNDINEIFLEDLGLPGTASILSIYLSTCSVGAAGYRPFVMPPTGDRHPLPRLTNPVRFFPSPVPPAPKGNNKLGLNEAMVTWVSETLVENPWARLVEAFSAFRADDLATAVTRAQTAVEEGVARVVTHQLSTLAPAIDSSRLNQSSYDYKYRVLLPIVAAVHQVAPLEERVVHWLRGMQRQRNALAHTGRPRGALTHGAVSQHLCGAVTALEYCRVLDR